VKALAVAAAAAALAATYFLWLVPDPALPPERRAGAARLMGELMSGKHPVGGPFTLADSAGRRVSLADFRGRLVLLYFGFSRCPDVCPTDLVAIAEALRTLGDSAAQVQPVFVTLDPERDTAAMIREYAAAFHPAFVALTGSEAEVRAVATSFKVFYEKVPTQTGGYTIDHAAFTFLLDRDGKFATLAPPGTPASRIAEMLREQLATTPAPAAVGSR